MPQLRAFPRHQGAAVSRCRRGGSTDRSADTRGIPERETTQDSVKGSFPEHAALPGAFGKNKGIGIKLKEIRYGREK